MMDLEARTQSNLIFYCWNSLKKCENNGNQDRLGNTFIPSTATVVTQCT